MNNYATSLHSVSPVTVDCLCYIHNYLYLINNSPWLVIFHPQLPSYSAVSTLQTLQPSSHPALTRDDPGGASHTTAASTVPGNRPEESHTVHHTTHQTPHTGFKFQATFLLMKPWNEHTIPHHTSNEFRIYWQQSERLFNDKFRFVNKSQRSGPAN